MPTVHLVGKLPTGLTNHMRQGLDGDICASPVPPPFDPALDTEPFMGVYAAATLCSLSHGIGEVGKAAQSNTASARE